ncbi:MULTISPECIES: hypothetical protein [unclassified Moorena]|uniref:hypothetical protein n=1 Tax=unclassified Moorena TaxID=2683338 RepID=UPI0013CA7326|nr:MULTISPECIES: hypothetical protein [unclassified Moorena]NEO15020.1 hypothetical protein [Moorena sp. SIO3E8]NEO17965.1 hypothetical protein [Moorena sp. SIO4A5]NEQ01424.1 hypothetical protein [Moorena sp. SIO3F7]NEQ56268.1 hypothetical protein [Moorena sp. SIO4A1]
MRYGADYPKAGYEAKNKGKSAPNAPYALLLPLASCLLPVPCSLLPTPYSLLPTPF